ncbi:MAG TPA: hypothetical protein PKH39_10880 [Woeseiaceae bacterium]|nr:hypothetical protein [Woeseiaceae bacterium]
MRIDLSRGAALALLVAFPAVSLAQPTEIELLRTAIDEIRADYDARIAELERRLAVAEQNVQQARSSAPGSVPAPGRTTSANPAIGVIFSGTAWDYSNSPEGYSIAGFPYGGEAGPIEEGLALGETEIIMNANVDDKFTAWLTLALALEDGEAVTEIEEAWVETTALPAGFSARLGRFFSGIGYLNSKHVHTWDFVDQPLPYQAFLGGQLIDDGLQVRWLAPTDLYLELGGEAMRGGQYPAASAAHDGVGSYSLFANVGADISSSSSWLAGVSYLDATAIDRPSGDEEDPLSFTGDSDLLAAQFVWKWSPNGNWKERNLILQGEYLRKHETGFYSGMGLVDTPYDVDQSGWYAQAIYQPIPRWRIGGRFDTLSGDNPGTLFDGTPLEMRNSDPRRFSLMADWSNSEFSRLRLQFTRDEAGMTDENQWGLQYIHSIGAHGAHTF